MSAAMVLPSALKSWCRLTSVASLVVCGALLSGCGLFSGTGGGSASAAAPPSASPGARFAAQERASEAGAADLSTLPSAQDEIVALRAELAALRAESERRVAEAEARGTDLHLELDRLRAQLASWSREHPPQRWSAWLAAAGLFTALVAIVACWQVLRAASTLTERLVQHEAQGARAAAAQSSAVEAAGTVPSSAANSTASSAQGGVASQPGSAAAAPAQSSAASPGAAAPAASDSAAENPSRPAPGGTPPGPSGARLRRRPPSR